MLSTFVVSEYENKLIHLMFSYPIKRRTIMASKILAVCIFNFIALLVLYHTLTRLDQFH